MQFFWCLNIYWLTRIFGDSFFNNKDIIFLSLITISLYYSLKLLSDFRSKNILLFSIFSALASAARIVGIFLPLSIISVLVFENLGKKFKKEFLLKIFSLIFLYIFFLIIFWPYLWESPFENFIRSFSVFSNYVVNIEFLYSGDYISSKSLPYSYILKWIFISTPIIILIFFVIGYLVGIKKIISRTLNIEKYDNPWSGDAEKKDFYMFVNFSLIVIYLIFSNVVLYNGWRQIYFLHIFIVYSSVYGLVYFDQYSSLPQKFRNITKTICFLFVFMIYAEIYKSHPFQSLFFNNLAPKETHKSYEIDYWGLAGKKFLESIISLEKGNKDKITIGVASWVPLHRSVLMLEPNIRGEF